jgi:hypothetical protein
MTEKAIQTIFEQAIPIDDYLAQEQVNRIWFARVREGVQRVADDPASAIFPAHVRLLILSEPYCGDCVLNLPLIAALGAASGSSAIRVASRDAYPEIAARFPGRNGASRLPTVIFLDASWNVLGHWSERSAKDHEWMAHFTSNDPLLTIELDNGHPAGAFASWLERRLSSQLPIFLNDNWKAIRDELVAVAAVREASVSAA